MSLPIETGKIRIQYEELRNFLAPISKNLDSQQIAAKLCASIFADSTLEGCVFVGVNRFPRLVPTLRNGIVNPPSGSGLKSQIRSMTAQQFREGTGFLSGVFQHITQAQHLAEIRHHKTLVDIISMVKLVRLTLKQVPVIQSSVTLTGTGKSSGQPQIRLADTFLMQLLLVLSYFFCFGDPGLLACI
jgi:hypothetical protein